MVLTILGAGIGIFLIFLVKSNSYFWSLFLKYEFIGVAFIGITVWILTMLKISIPLFLIASSLIMISLFNYATCFKVKKDDDLTVNKIMVTAVIIISPFVLFYLWLFFIVFKLM
jgi:hypothetical protein